MKTNQKGIAHLLLILIVAAVLCVAALAFWRIDSMDNDKAKTKTPAPAQASVPKRLAVKGPPCAKYPKATSAEAAMSLEDIQKGAVGKWVGCVSTPWASSYSIAIELKADGAYSAQYIGNEIKKDEIDANGVWPAMYRGVNEDNPAKKYSIYGLNDNGKAIGEITIYFGEDSGGSTNQDFLENIILKGDNLSMDLWYGLRSEYGPVEFRLSRAD